MQCITLHGMLHSALLCIASQEERKQRAKMQGLQPHQVPGAEGLSVRVVNSVLKKCETRPRFVDAFSGADGYPADFPYRQRVVVLFQVCVWRGVCRCWGRGLQVQEKARTAGLPGRVRMQCASGWLLCPPP